MATRLAAIEDPLGVRPRNNLLPAGDVPTPDVVASDLVEPAERIVRADAAGS